MWASHRGNKPTAPIGRIYLNIYRFGKQSALGGQYHDIRIMCGAERLVVLNERYSSDMDDGDCNEHMSATIAITELGHCLALNRDLEVKVGIAEPWPLGPQAREKIKDYLTFLRRRSGQGTYRRNQGTPERDGLKLANTDHR